MIHINRTFLFTVFIIIIAGVGKLVNAVDGVSSGVQSLTSPA